MNTLENKAKFFALYYDQEILWSNDILFKCLTEWGTVDDSEYLELTPLSQITEEDTIYVGYIINNQAYKNYINDQFVNEDCKSWIEGSMRPVLSIKQSSRAIDYLRSKGYALPWMGISVEQMIEWGWVKLKQK